MTQPPPGPYQPYQMPPPIPGLPPVVQDHPEARKVFVLGLVGHLCCGITSPFAVVIGARVRREVKQANGAVGGWGLATAGWVLGIVGCVSLAVVVLYVAFLVVLAVTGNLD